MERDDLIGYGELWVDSDRAGVELARLIVALDRRGQGVGRWLAVALANEALRIHPVVFLRVRPDNGAALRCYAAAGFRRVAVEEEADWNTHQPVAYLWLAYNRDGTVLFEGDVP
jgi:ribosomal protein S18 acetylase RimI-like enzyme